MYKTKYTYDERDYPSFSSFLKKLYSQSIQKYSVTVAKESLPTEQIRDKRKIKEFVEYVEDYVHGLKEEKYITSNNLDFVLGQIKKLETIIPTEKRYRGIFGVTNKNDIAINPTLSSSSQLTSSERTKLYVFHELGHLIHQPWMDDIDICINEMKKNKNLNNTIAQNPDFANLLIKYGFWLLDEATSQEIAEDLVYKQANKTRPKMSYHIEPKIFSGELHKSNFDFYQPLHEPACFFGRTLKGIGNSSKTEDETIMNELAKRSFKRNFLTDIVNEYQETKELEEDLFMTMINLGMIKDAAYSLFLAGSIPNSLSSSQRAFTTLKELCQKNEDYRPKINR